MFIFLTIEVVVTSYNCRKKIKYCDYTQMREKIEHIVREIPNQCSKYQMPNKKKNRSVVAYQKSSVIIGVRVRAV